MAIVASATSKVYSGFSPTSIPGCMLWLDGQDSNTLTLSGSNVTQWNDKSGRGYSAVGSVAPTYNATTKYLVFGGNATGQYMTVSDGAYPSGNSPYSIFIVSYTNDITAQQWIVAGGVRTLNQGIGVLYLTTAAIWVGWWGGEYKLENVTANGVPHLINATYSASTRRTYLNGGSNISNNPNATRNNPTTPNYIGTILDPRIGAFLDGGVGEIVIYNSDLSPFERRQVEGYLTEKWGLSTRLPTTHPYRPNDFNPREIPGCLFWVDAADSATLTLSGSNVTQWTDKSGSNVTLTASGTPTRGTYNGLNVVQFAGSGGGGPYLQNTGFTNTGPYAIFYVMKFNGFVNLEWQTLTDNVSGLRPFVGYDGTSLQRTSMRYGGTPTINPEIWSLQYSTNDVTVFNVNGSNVRGASTGYGGVGHTSGIRVGLAGNAGAGLNGWIGEILIFSGTLSTNQIQRVESYLSTKWGITGSNLTSLAYYRIPAPVFTRSFTPLDISGCALWLDAMDNTTLTTSGSNITSWRDKSGNGYNFNTAPSGCSLPVLGNPINGRQTIGITTSTMGIKQATVINGINTIVWVRRERTGNRAYEFYFGADSTADFHTGVSEYAGSGLAQNGVRDASLALITANGTTYATPGTTNVTSASDVNILEITNLTGNTRVQGLSYDRGNVGRSMQCDWGEVLCYANNLTASQMNMLEGYLAQRWGIRSSHLGSNHPLKVLPAVSPVFTPRQIPGCSLWLDAADPSTLRFSGSNVIQWNDKSGNSYNLTPVGVFSNAVVQSNYQNNMNVLNFTGSNIYRGVAGSAVYPVDVYILVAVKDLNARCDVISIAGTSADNFNSLTLGEATTKRWHNGSDNFNRTPNTVSPSDETSTGFLLMNWSLSNNNYVIRRNGVQLSSTNSYTFTLTSGSVFQIGVRYAHGNSPDIPFNAYVAEVVAFNTQLQINERQMVEGYLASRWGLKGNLSSTHPFKTITP